MAELWNGKELAVWPVNRILMRRLKVVVFET